MESGPLQELARSLANPVQIVKWLEAQAPESQKSHANSLFDRLLKEAGQPRSASGQACVRLCGLVEQSSKANSEELQSWAFSRTVTLQLFYFFIDWNDADHHRSMKLVLDLIVDSLRRNSDRDDALNTTRDILDSLISIAIGHATRPVSKSVIKSLDHFFAKGVFTLDDIRSSYVAHREELSQSNSSEIWRMFTADFFRLMRLRSVSQSAGRFIVCVYRCWGQEGPSIETWYQWLLDFVFEEPSLLESIKNYIFLPLFKADRVQGLRFLGKMVEERVISRTSTLDFDTPALLQLAALETGKKVGLVEEPDLGADRGRLDECSSIMVHEHILDIVLAHHSHQVRSLALSLLVTSPSTTRPYSFTALELLRKHLGAIFADPDPKFRVEVSGKVRDIFKRVRGAIHILKRSIPRARANAQKAKSSGQESQASQDLAVTTQPILYRSNLVILPEAQLAHCLEYHEGFLRWYIGFLCSELTPTASYQRHVASLKALISVLQMEGETLTSWETEDDQRLFFDLFDDKWARALFDLLMDPFEDVRDISALALQRLYADQRYRRFSLNSHASERHVEETLIEVLRRAEELARRTSRADHSDGASKASRLLYRCLNSGEKRVSLLSRMVVELDRKTAAAESDLGRAVLDAPLHGDFASLNHVWQVASELKLSKPDLEAVQLLQSGLVSCCERVWKVVRDVLCDDSPECHLPQDLEELEGIDTKSLLSFSFRAIHESSNLMRTMIVTTRNRSREGFISPTEELFEKIGNLMFSQLLNLRHRGALTTVSLTFATCCQQTKHSDRGKALLQIWYRDTIDAIQVSKVSTTRRSAGIPSMMTGILAANASHPSLDHVMKMLMSIAGKEARVSETDDANFPQVHAYNCLKDIFKNSMLASMGIRSEKYLPECLELAAGGLCSEVWAIRNCGLIFLRSLVDCLFGSQERKDVIEAGWDGKANRIPYHRYPNLPTVLRNLVKSGHQMLAQTAATVSAAESVFPALDIIRRAGPPNLLRDEIQVDVAVYLSSPVWHVRELAARTLCSCLLHERWLETVKDVFRKALLSQSRSRQNHVHGVLLTLKFVIERLNKVAVDCLIADLSSLTSFLAHIAIDSKFPDCPEIAAAYLEVVNLIWAFERANARLPSPFKVTMPTSSWSALLGKQKVIHDMYAASAEADPVRSLRALLLGQNAGADGLVAALETVPKLLDATPASQQTLAQLCALYVDICLETGLIEAQVVAIRNLTETLDQLLGQDKLDKALPDSLVELWSALSSRPMNPALSNAVISASGCIVAVVRKSRGTCSVDLRRWGSMMSDAGLEDQTFDTRLAAARSLYSFFAAVGPCSKSEEPCCRSEECLPSLLALYDALNDDDEEVRAVGSAAVKGIIGKALVPIEATNRLLLWLARHFGGSPIFKAQVASRMVGHYGIKAVSTDTWEPAQDELARALEFDDSLFVVEEQNLFVDEVRETARWVGVFENLLWDADDETLARLDGWITGGIVELAKLLQREDGPLGWASNPRVFAIGTRLVRASVAVAKQHTSPALRDAISSAKEALRLQDTRASRLLTEGWEHMQ